MKATFAEQVSSWYEKEPGMMLHKIEMVELQAALPRLFGYYLLQIGYALDPTILQECPIHHQYYLGPSSPGSQKIKPIQAELTQLPLQPESLDAIIVFHALEFIANPQKLLHEIYAALIPGGSVIIFGFNPHSLMGLTQLWQDKQLAPWTGKFISPWHLRKLLTKTKFSVGDYKTFFFRPLLKNENLLKKLLFLESIGQMFLPYFGASYMFCCKKMVLGTTLVLPEARNNHLVPTSSPATRFSKLTEQLDDNYQNEPIKKS